MVVPADTRRVLTDTRSCATGTPGTELVSEGDQRMLTVDDPDLPEIDGYYELCCSAEA